MIPPMSPPQSNTGATDRSDSSGLMEGDPDDWATAAEPNAPDAPAGARAGETPTTTPILPPLLPVVLPVGVPRSRNRDERKEQAPAGAQRTDGAGPDADRDEPVILPPLVLPPGAPDRRRRQERSEAGELLAEEETTWDPPPDYVALVRESDDDFDSWDADPLPWVNDQATTPPGEDDPDSWGVPEPAGDVGGIPPPVERVAPPPARPRPAGRSYEAALLAEMPLRSGGPDLTPEQLDELEHRR